MTNKRASVATAMVIVSMILAGQVLAGDWPHWRGPYLNGTSDEKSLPATWSTTQNVAWRAPLPGHSAATPVIAGGKVKKALYNNRGVVSIGQSWENDKTVYNLIINNKSNIHCTYFFNVLHFN